MINTVNTNYTEKSNGTIAKKHQTNIHQEETVSFLDKVIEKSESVVEQYKRKHPEDASHVDSQVRAGKAVLTKNGVDNISREGMTMDEYKSFINGLLKSIPFNSTRIYDREIISISETGWEQMKNDSDYEAWVLGYTAENRSVRNPFFGWPGASGSFYVEKFGASIEEHIGQSIGKSGCDSNFTDYKKKKSWWKKRQEKMEELMDERVDKAIKKAQAKSILEQEHYLNSRLASQHRLQNFLTDNAWDNTDIMYFQYAGTRALAAMAYENNISTYSRNAIKRRK